VEAIVKGTFAKGPYRSEWQLKNGTPVVIRPIVPDDEPKLVHFHEALSDRSVMFRYLHAIRLSTRISHERLAKVCQNDFEHGIALVALSGDEVLAIGRLSKEAGSDTAEIAVVVIDGCQKQGLGSHLVELLIQVGRSMGQRHLTGTVLIRNAAMIRVLKGFGFTTKQDSQEGTVEATLTL
jgi:acetyltransferase